MKNVNSEILLFYRRNTMYSPNNRDTIIWLSSIGLDSKAIRNLMLEFTELKDIWKSNNNRISSIKTISKRSREKIIENRKETVVKDILKKLEEENVNILTIYDEDYPIKLMTIPNRPKVLYYKGKKLDDKFSIAIVGSRKCTDYGRWACIKFTRELSNLGVSIISGLALGVDSIAHRESIEANNYTVAVLGCGLDIVYPRKNKGLYDDLINYGTIVSEYPLGTPPKPYNFPHRNRIISGLSNGVIVVEAKDKSGTLITVGHALDQGKDVYAIPGNINSMFSSGTNKLIRDGAIPLLNIQDIIDRNGELEKKLKEIKDTVKEDINFSETEKKILSILEQPMHSDNIVYETGIDISTINTMLVGLELKGAIEEIGNNIFIRI